MLRRLRALAGVLSPHRRLLSSQYLAKRAQRLPELSTTLPELLQQVRRFASCAALAPDTAQERLLQQLMHEDDVELGVAKHLPPRAAVNTDFPLSSADTCLTAGLLTFALHIEARIASAIGEGATPPPLPPSPPATPPILPPPPCPRHRSIHPHRHVSVRFLHHWPLRRRGACSRRPRPPHLRRRRTALPPPVCPPPLSHHPP